MMMLEKCRKKRRRGDERRDAGSRRSNEKVSRTGRLVPFLNSNDTGPIWDGYIAVYKSPKQPHTKDDLILRIPVQIKGQKGKTDEPEIRYAVELADLRKYSSDNPTVFFVVRMDEAENETVYYCAFTKERAEEIVRGKDTQKTVALSFYRFPTASEEKEKLFFDLAGGVAEEINVDTPARAPLSYTDVFLYNAGIVEFWGRSRELEALEDFLACPGDFRWWGIAAPDGMGKSRLALEFIQELEEAGTWTALFLRKEDYVALDSLIELYADPLLLIADDALYHVDELGKWMSKLSSGWTRSEPLRILLLERDEGRQYDSFAWERQLYKAGHEQLLRGSRFGVPLHLETLDDESLVALIQDFASALRKREPLIPLLHREEEKKLLSVLEECDPKRRPLFAMVLTAAFLHDRSSVPSSQESLLDWLVNRERRRLRESIRTLSTGDGSKDEALFSVCMRLRRIAGAIGRQGVLDSSNLAAYCPEELAFLSAQAEDCNLGSAEELLLYLGLLQASDGCFSLAGFRPEFLAEYELLNWLCICNTPSREQERAVFFWAVLCSGKALGRFFTRLFSDYTMLLQRDPSLWERLLPDNLNLDDQRIAAYSRLLYNGFYRCLDRGQRLRLLQCMERHAAKLCQTDTDEAGIVYNNLCLVYGEMADYPRALEYAQKSLAICERVNGTEHPDTATCYSSMSAVYYDMGNYPQALRYCQKALAIREKVLDSDHPDTATSCRNLGTVYSSIRDFPVALKYHQKALEIFGKAFGTEHPDTALTYNNVGMMYYAMGGFPQALGYCQKALAIYENVLGSDHPNTASIYNNIGAVYYAMGEFPQALGYCQKALAIYENVLGSDHPNIAANCNILGNVYHAMEDYPNAIESFKKAMVIIKKVYGPDHPYTATSHAYLGGVYRAMRDFPHSIDSYQKALAIREKVLGADHPITAVSCNNLGILYYGMGNYRQAKEYMQRAMSICEKKLGADHPDTQYSQRWLAVIEEKIK